jgi:hypothetical protein
MDHDITCCKEKGSIMSRLAILVFLLLGWLMSKDAAPVHHDASDADASDTVEDYMLLCLATT